MIKYKSKINFQEQGRSLIGIIIVLVAAGLIGGCLYYYLQKRIPVVIQRCTDEIPYGQCSLTKPKYCNNGNLIDKCSTCACPSGQECQSDDSCKTGVACQNECSQTGLKRCLDDGYQICGNYDADGCLEWSSVTNCPVNTICQNGRCTESEEIKPEAVLPKNSKCFWQENRDKPECSLYYKKDGSLACPQYFNPVYDSDGIFYPSACWAQKLGASIKGYGYSNKFLQFIRDLWRTKGYEVPSPDIEFTYNGSGLGDNGTWIRSVLWKDTSNFIILDFNIERTYAIAFSTTLSEQKTFFPVINFQPKTLLVFVIFDKAYPEEVLLNWTKTYESLMNDYIKKKQKVQKPIQYDIVPAIISPSPGVEKPSSPNHLYFSNEEMQKIYDAAIQKVGLQNFKVFIVVPVFINGFGGYYSVWNNMQFIEAPLIPPAAYSITDKKADLDALAAFQGMFLTISHEVLHAVGLPGDHVPMGYGTMYLDYVGAGVDPVTGIGEIYSEKVNPCDFLGNSPDYYAVELPDSLKIRTGEEPSWLYKEKSSSGDCLSGLYNNERLKDFDRDGEYEIMYKNNLIGRELQRALGWVDVDGDNIAELIDPIPYGGWKGK